MVWNSLLSIRTHKYDPILDRGDWVTGVNIDLAMDMSLDSVTPVLALFI